MSKQRKSNREERKKPAMTLKEKRAAKKAGHETPFQLIPDKAAHKKHPPS
jgi:hypothetical protein